MSAHPHDTTITPDERAAIGRRLLFSDGVEVDALSASAVAWQCCYGTDVRRLLAALEAAESFVTDELRKEREHNGRLLREVEAVQIYRDLADRLHKKHTARLDELSVERAERRAADGKAANWRSHFERYGQHLKHCRCRDSDGWVAGKYGKFGQPDTLSCDCGLTGVLALLRAARIR